MSERGPSVSQGTHTLPDAVTLFVGNKVYEGWEDVKITRELNSAASDFEVQVTDKWRPDEEPWRIAAGEAVHIHVGTHSILTGYVDKVSPSFSRTTKSIVVQGRSKTGDLVDCSVEGPSEYQGLTVKEMADKVCKPFGISVSLIGDVGAAFPKITLQQGETVFALLDRLCRERKLLMYPTYEGNLVISSLGTSVAASEIRQGVNILGGSGTHDNSNRFSKYLVKGQNMGFLGDKEQAVGALGEATDSGITRYRPLILLAENNASDQSSQDRASYEAGLRAGKALTAQVSVQGWFQSNGKPWEINQLVFVDSGFLGLRRKMLIQKVQFNKSGAGTLTEISLIREDAYGFKKNLKKEDPLGWTKFLK